MVHGRRFVAVDLVEYIKMARRYSSMSDKEKLYEDLKRGRSTTSGRRRRTSDTPVMAGPRVDRTPEAPTAAELAAAEGKRRNLIQQALAADKAPKKVARARFGVGSSKTITHKGKSFANVSATQLKKTGMSLPQYLNAWNKTGKRPTAKKKESAMTRAEAREAGITGGRVLSRAGARKAGLTGPELPEVKKVPSPVKRAITAPTATLTAAQLRTAQDKRRYDRLQGLSRSKGGAVNKSRGTGAAETGTGFQGVF